MTDTQNDEVMEPGLWKKNGWIARVIKNEDDDGWAVEMTRIGDDEPSLTGPWTMGRDKKNPKPLDQPSFMTLVKGASEVIMRHEQAARARLHRSFSYRDDEDRGIRLDLDIAEDDDDPHAMLAAFDERTSELLRRGRVRADYKLNASNAKRFVDGGDES